MHGLDSRRMLPLLLPWCLRVLVVNFLLSERKKGLEELPRHGSTVFDPEAQTRRELAEVQNTKKTKPVRDCWVIGPAC